MHEYKSTERPPTREIAKQYHKKMRTQFILARGEVRLRAKFVEKGLVICSKDGEYLSEQWLGYLLDGSAKIEEK